MFLMLLTSPKLLHVHVAHLLCQFVIFVRDPSPIILALPVRHLVSPRFEFCTNCWSDQSCYIDFSKSLHGFVKIDTWISLICYMAVSKLPYGFVKLVTWIGQSCFMYFSPFAKQNQAEV